MNIEQVAAWLASVIAAAAIAFIVARWKYVTDFTERHAAPLREIPEADRTLKQKLIIEADRKADLMNIEQYGIFLESYVGAILLDVLKRAPVVGPMVVAADYVDDMLEKLADGNPQLAKRLDQSYETAKRKLAGAIGQAVQRNGVTIQPHPTPARSPDVWVAPHVPVARIEDE